MTENYLNAENLTTKGQEFLRECNQRSLTKDNEPSWKNSALLILDMQRYFLDEKSHAFVPSSPNIIAGLVKLANVFKSKGLPIICTRHINNAGSGSMMETWWNDLIVESNELSQMIPEIQKLNTPIYSKTEYDSFYKTPLEEALNKQGIKDLIITGVMTHLCVETTVRSAFVRGFQPILPVDGTVTYNEAFHRASLLNLSHGFAKMTTMDKLIDSLSNTFIENNNNA